MMRRITLAFSAATFAVALTACGERPQVIQYSQGKYAGKPDQKPFAGPPWNGDKNQWSAAIRTRNQAQNEYKGNNN